MRRLILKTKQLTSGVTLVELLVAFVVGAILVGALYQVLVNQNRVYVVEEQDIVMQQNARAALDFMGRELRAAGFGVPDDDNPTTNLFPQLVNNAPAGTEHTDKGTDVIMFMADTEYGSTVAEAAGPGSREIFVYPAPVKSLDFQDDKEAPDLVDLIAFDHGEKKKLNKEPLKITSVSYPRTTAGPRLTRLGFEKQLWEVLSNMARDKGLEEGDQVVICPITVRYRVRGKVLERSLSSDGGHRWKSTQPLINNVEDFQLTYAFDGPDAGGEPDMQMSDDDEPLAVIRAVDAGAEGVLDRQVLACGEVHPIEVIAYRSDTAVVAADASVGDPCSNPLRSVRISLLVRSDRQNPNLHLRNRNLAPQVQDHDPFAGVAKSGDGYLRRVYKRDIAFRNLGLAPPPPAAPPEDEGEGEI